MKLTALESLDPAQLAKALSRHAIFKKSAAGINNPRAERKKQPFRSGNTETPVKPEHKGLMGQPDNPHGTIHSKMGPPGSATSAAETIPSNDLSRPSMVNLGQPFDRGLSTDLVGDSADLHPVDKDGDDHHTRREGPAEDPGRKRDGSLGFNRARIGLTRHIG